MKTMKRCGECGAPVDGRRIMHDLDGVEYPICADREACRARRRKLVEIALAGTRQEG